MHPVKVGRRKQPGFADDDPLRRHHWSQQFAGFKPGLERFEVPVVDAEEFRIEPERPLQFLFVMHL